jgi:hypothetical protein
MSWRDRFRARRHVKNSLWLAPLVAGLGGLVLAELAYGLDMRTDLQVHQYSPETATAVVSATIAAVVSLTGFVITVTVLGVQQATSIFSPRYMRLWYRDARLKLALAELVGTLMFSMSVIRRIQPGAVPSISVSMAGLGLSVGLLLFLLYFGRFLHGMRPVAVAALLAREGRGAFEDWVAGGPARRRPRHPRLGAGDGADLHPPHGSVEDHPGGRHQRPDRVRPPARLPDRVPALRRRLRAGLTAR